MAWIKSIFCYLFICCQSTYGLVVRLSAGRGGSSTLLMFELFSHSGCPELIREIVRTIPRHSYSLHYRFLSFSVKSCSRIAAKL